MDEVKGALVMCVLLVMVLGGLVFGLTKLGEHENRRNMDALNKFINDCNSRGGTVSVSNGFWQTTSVCNVPTNN